MTPIWIFVSADDVRLFEDRARVDAWEGGFADLIRAMRANWELHGPNKMCVEDFATYQRLQHYGNDFGAGTWQTIIKRWSDQMPAAIVDPQGDLFGGG